MRRTCKSDAFLEDEFGLEEDFGFKVNAKGGGGGGSQTTTTRPFPAQEQALTRLFNRAESQFQEGPTQFFPGQTLAAEDVNTQLAQAEALGQVPALSQFGDAALQSAISGVNAARLGSDEFESLAAGLTNPIIDRFQEDLIPGISSAAARQGAFGGSRQGLQEAVASREVARALADARTGLFETGQQNLARLIGLQPQLQASALSGANVLSNVGASRQAREQAEIDAARERFEFEQLAPEMALDRLASRISGINIGGTSTSKASGGGGFSGGGALGGALAGAKLGSVVPGIGTAIGAIGGGILGGLF